MMEKNSSQISAREVKLHQEGVGDHAGLQLGDCSEDLFTSTSFAQSVFPGRRLFPNCFSERQPAAHNEKQHFSTLGVGMEQTHFIGFKSMFSSGLYPGPTQLMCESEVVSAEDDEDEAELDTSVSEEVTVKTERGKSSQGILPPLWCQPPNNADHGRWGIYGKTWEQLLAMQTSESNNEHCSTGDITAKSTLVMGQGKSTFDRFHPAVNQSDDTKNSQREEFSRPVHQKIMQALKQSSNKGSLCYNDQNITGCLDSVQHSSSIQQKETGCCNDAVLVDGPRYSEKVEVSIDNCDKELTPSSGHLRTMFEATGRKVSLHEIVLILIGFLCPFLYFSASCCVSV